jgi:hypothetical protein
VAAAVMAGAMGTGVVVISAASAITCERPLQGQLIAFI